MQKKGLILANSTALVLGIGPLFAKFITLPAAVIILGRMLVAIPILVMVVLIRRDSLRLSCNRDWFSLIVASLLMMLHWVAFYKSIQLSSVAIGVITLYSYPFFTAIFESLVKKHSVRPIQLLFGLLIVLGVYMLSYAQYDSTSLSSTSGIIWGLISAITVAFRNILIKPLTSQMRPQVILLVHSVVGAICLAPLFPELIPISTKNTVLILISGVVFTAIGHSLVVKCLEYLSATSAGIILSFQIVYSTFFAWWLLQEPVSWTTLIGASLILLTVVLEQVLVMKSPQKNQ